MPVAHSPFGVERQPHFSQVVCDSLNAGMCPGSYADLATGSQRAAGHFNSDIGMTTRSALDARKQAKLEAAGYRVLRITWGQTAGSPAQTLARIRAALDGG